MSYLKANIFWKNLIKNVLPGKETFRREQEFEIDRQKRGEKFVFFWKLIGLLAAIVAVALLLSLIGVMWFGI